MTEQFILAYIPQRIRELGYSEYHFRYRDLLIEAGTTRVIEAYNQLYFMVGDPEGVLVDSDYGVYDTTGTNSIGTDNTHQHKGQITISNPGAIARQVKFIQVIIVS
jgi:hypothetical protein